MKVYVNNLYNHQICILNHIELIDQVRSIELIISNKFNIPIDTFYLTSCNELLHRDFLLIHTNIYKYSNPTIIFYYK